MPPAKLFKRAVGSRNPQIFLLFVGLPLLRPRWAWPGGYLPYFTSLNQIQKLSKNDNADIVPFGRCHCLSALFVRSKKLGEDLNSQRSNKDTF